MREPGVVLFMADEGNEDVGAGGGVAVVAVVAGEEFWLWAAVLYRPGGRGSMETSHAQTPSNTHG